MKKFMQILYIKFTILRISLFKNLTIISSIFLIVIASLVISGAITEDTPLLGWLFGGLSTVFNNIWNNIQCDGVVSAMTPVISVLASMLVIVTKLKNIGLTDVKSKKVKIAIARCGLVLNNRGFLVKRENLKTNSTSVTEPSNIISDAFNTIGEIGTVLTATVDTESTDETILNQIESPVIKEEIDDSETETFMGKIKNILSKIWSAIKDFIGIFKKENNEIEENVVEENVEEVYEPVVTEEILAEAREEISNQSNKVDENINIIIDNVEVIEIDDNEEKLKYDSLNDIGDQILTAADIDNSKANAEINDAISVAATIDNIIDDVKNIKNDNANKQSTKKSNTASDLLARLNANRK